MYAIQQGQHPVHWKASDFTDLIDRYGISHNAVLGFFTGR
jgi:hypothetical protein